MLSGYRSLFAAPRGRIALASLSARLAMAAVFLPLVLLANKISGSFAFAGVTVAAFMVPAAALAPVRGRLVDRAPGRILAVMTLVHGLALGTVSVASSRGGLAVAAAIAGASSPPLAGAMRACWRAWLGTGPELRRAYALEASAQDGLAVAGPLLAGAGIAVLSPATVMVVLGAIVLAGGLAFSAGVQLGEDLERTSGWGPLRSGGLRTLILSVLLADAGLGLVEIGLPAFSIRHGAPGAAGALLAVLAGGSVAGGLTVGARDWSAPAGRRYLVATAASIVTLAPLAAAGSFAALVPLLLFAGLPFAVQWSALSALIDGLVPAGALTEAYTWLTTANAAGLALGTIVGGALISSGNDATMALLAAPAAAAAATLVALLRRTSLGEAAPRLSGERA